MSTANKNFPAKGFSTPPPTWKSKRSFPPMPCSERKRTSPQSESDLFHVIHKVPAGDSPYVRAKHVQLVDKDPSRAISMFWAAINSGDRVDSALKDMAVVMKQLNRSEEAIEAIKSFRHLCPQESQESLDNLLLELYKRSGRIEEQIEMLQVKLKHIEEGIGFGGKRTKAARSQGKKIQITIEQEYSRLLGNLAWAYLQLNDYKLAEELYRKALSLEQDKNKQCNLAICLMHMNNMTEAKFLLQTIRSSSENGLMDESYAKSYERAVQMMSELESQQAVKPVTTEGYSRKETQSRADFDIERNNYASPVSAGRILRVPFTQPRRCSWTLSNGVQRRGRVEEDHVVGCNRKLLFEQPRNDRNVLQPNQNRDVKLPPFTSEMSKGAHKVSENYAPSINGDWRKAQWGTYDNGHKNVATTEFNLPTLSPTSVAHSPNFANDDSVRTEQITEDLKAAQELKSQSEPVREIVEEPHDFLMCKSKKSWADMVEEDEQELLSGGNDFYTNNFIYPSQESLFFAQTQSQSCYVEEFGDENIDCNIDRGTPGPLNQIEGLNEKIQSSLGLKDGYYTQPENGDLTMNNNQRARRSLCFDQHEKKALNFEGHNNNSPLSNQSKCTSGSGNSKSTRRKRLPVFQDITPF